jgi:hypothetical protein
MFLNLLEKQKLESNVIECDNELMKSFDMRQYVEVTKSMRLEPSVPDTQSQNGGGDCDQDKSSCHESCCETPSASLERNIPSGSVLVKQDSQVHLQIADTL